MKKPSAKTCTVTETPWENPHGFSGVTKLVYPTGTDTTDWALAWPGNRNQWVVLIHGHGSTGDQIFTRADIRDHWLSVFRRLGFGVLAVNLRGNAWMCPAAANDLHRLLGWMRTRFQVKAFLFFSGSMGGTSNLIYAMLHPRDVQAVVALCPATDIGSYADWCEQNPGGVRDEIRRAIVVAYGGSPAEKPAVYAAHSAVKHADRLTMPLWIAHGDADPLIPVEQSRRLAARMNGRPGFRYLEMPGGGHDTPLLAFDIEAWLTTHAG